MKIKNLTHEIQALNVVDLMEGREFTIYIEGGSITDIQGMYAPTIDKYKNIFKIVDIPTCACAKVVEEVVTPQITADPITHEEISTDDHENTDESDEESQESTATSLTNAFICDVCGAEFASARGLNTHKSRAHLEE